jgi:hypothetical protein
MIHFTIGGFIDGLYYRSKHGARRRCDDETFRSRDLSP